VLFESGYAASSLAWSKVQALLAPKYRVCAYDRAGYGFSDPGPEPRDGAAIARDLDQGLTAAGLEGPFIVVGHSAGGLYVRLFTNRRWRDVVGMVLVDPSVEYQDHRFAAVFGAGAGGVSALREQAARCLEAARLGQLQPPPSDTALINCLPRTRTSDTAAVSQRRLAEALRPTTWITRISELDTLWTRTSDEIASGRRAYDSLPLIVLTADGTYAGAPESNRPALLRLWITLHQDLAGRSSRGQQRLVEGSSHLMMLDRPDAIAAAVEEEASQMGRYAPQIHDDKRQPPNRPLGGTRK
jgi:pimeloyl-ACP methyl ester carboxylesterase